VVAVNARVRFRIWIKIFGKMLDNAIETHPSSFWRLMATPSPPTFTCCEPKIGKIGRRCGFAVASDFRSMFGCVAISVRDKILLILR
jgi:hypothetical protein